MAGDHLGTGDRDPGRKVIAAVDSPLGPDSVATYNKGQWTLEWIGASQETLSLFLQGVYQSMGGNPNRVRMLCPMHLITGKIGHPGSAPFSITGQATAMSNLDARGSSTLAG